MSQGYSNLKNKKELCYSKRDLRVTTTGYTAQFWRGNWFKQNGKNGHFGAKHENLNKICILNKMRIY